MAINMTSEPCCHEPFLRGTMKKIADQDSWATPATIEDPKALEEIQEALAARAQ